MRHRRGRAPWTEGVEVLLEELRKIDPAAAEKLHLRDEKRILRALEVYLATGETITAHNLRTQAVPPRYEAVQLGLCTEPRAILYGRIDRRVDQMLDQGLAQEVRQLQQEGRLVGTAAQAIGYKEMLDYLAGRVPLEQAAELIRQKSRNYAKRQLTWFRRKQEIRWITYSRPEMAGAILQEATEYLRKTLYNGDEPF